MVVSLAGRLGTGPFNRVRSRWNDDPCACAVTQNCVVGRIAIIGPIGGDLADLIFDLIQQRFQLRGIAGFLICQAMCNDLATVGINRQVQLSPTAARLCSVLDMMRSGTGRSNPIISSTELKNPSLWRNRNPNTMPSISVVSIARSE